MANSYLNRTQSAGTSDKIGTFSAWIKASDYKFSFAIFVVDIQIVIIDICLILHE